MKETHASWTVFLALYMIMTRMQDNNRTKPAANLHQAWPIYEETQVQVRTNRRVNKATNQNENKLAALAALGVNQFARHL